jgi:[NiFe] hydrogenase assembly HybE family chaperone
MADLMDEPALTNNEAVAARLEAAFERVWRERMHDVPILNPALAVKAVGTRDVEAGWLAALVTPWFINLMLLPRTPEQLQAYRELPLGSTLVHGFPSGGFEFIVGEEGDLGRYQMCSLFSPVLEFESQGAALITAEAALTALFDTRLAADAPPQAGAALDATAVPPSPRAPAAAEKLSRRGLIFGRHPDTGAVAP